MAISSQCSVCSKTDTSLSNWPDARPQLTALKNANHKTGRPTSKTACIATNFTSTIQYDPTAAASDDTNNLMNIISKTLAMDKAQFDRGGWQGDANEPRKYLARFVDDREWSRENPQPVDCVHQRSWVHPRTPQKGASQTRLFEVLDKPAYKGQKLTYLYDYGDCWRHDISVVGTAAATRKIKRINGGGHYVAEDAGCFPGWLEIVEAYETSNPSQEQRERRRWFEQQTINRDPAGLEGDGLGRWDQVGINMKLSVLA
ncbi:hypothetical protein Slin14017_G101940 [Septoria linicola]|nr:hypothetical protein Slin14017_G101940 [Septoria linicola]